MGVDEIYGFNSVAPSWEDLQSLQPLRSNLQLCKSKYITFNIITIVEVKVSDNLESSSQAAM